MRTKKLLIFSCLLVAIIAGIICILHTTKEADVIYQNIDVIYITYATYISPILSPQVTIREYKIDLNKEKLWYFFIDYIPTQYTDDYTGRDGTAKKRDYISICDLENNAIKSFLYEAARAKFLDWEEFYPARATDCPGWLITIEFADGTNKEINVGANNNPDSWNDMYKALKKLTGLEIIYRANVTIRPTDDYPGFMD